MIRPKVGFEPSSATFTLSNNAIHPYEGKPEVLTKKGRKKAELAFTKASKTLRAWFEKSLINTPLQVIGPSEYRGWITGEPCYFTADFGPQELAFFQSEWDECSPWFVEIWPVSDWRKRVDSAQLLSSPVDELQKLHWWDTLNGILLLSAYIPETDYCENGFLSLEDGWWRLQQLRPDLAHHHSRSFSSGKFLPFMIDKTQADIFVDFEWEFWGSKTFVDDPQNLRRITEAINIPEGIYVKMQIDDF